MSDKNNKHNQLRLKLYEKLSEAEALEVNGGFGISHEDMMARLKKITNPSHSE